MKKPRFNAKHGQISCKTCPVFPLNVSLCTQWLRDHDKLCPTIDTYTESLEFAEQHRHTIVTVGGAHG